MVEPTSVLIGRRAGRLVVESFIPARSGDDPKPYARVSCRCDCGNTCLRTASVVHSRHVPSCGCRADSRLLDLGGRRFGMLVPELLLPKGDRQGRRWQCICDCKRRVPVRTKDLRNGNTTSCGCKLNRLEVNREGLSARQDGLLRHIGTAGGTLLQGQVAALLGVCNSAAVRNLIMLERRNLLRRRLDPAYAGRNGRGNVVELLPDGVAYLRQEARDRARRLAPPARADAAA